MSRRNRRNKFQSNFGRNTYSSSSSTKRRTTSKGSLQMLVSDILELNTRNLTERFILVGLTVATAGAAVLVFFAVLFAITLPSVSEANNLMGTESTVIYDRNGKVIHTVHGEEDRDIVESADIPQVVKDATVAIEDDQFYGHNGFDIPALIKAVLSEVGIGKARGGSTITQQFIKNSVLSSERTYTRKLKELVLAVQLEKHFTKDEILTMYLNRIPYGGTAYGIERGAEVFFDKDAKELNLVEAAILASLPNAPTYYSPFGDHKYSKLDVTLTADDIKKRKIKDITDLESDEYSLGLIGQNIALEDGSTLYLPGRVDNVLAKMEDQNMITKEERDLATQQSLTYEFHEYTPLVKDAFHFVDYVKDLLVEEYGEDFVANGGLQITTTLDIELQKSAQAAINERSAGYSNSFNAENAASLTVNPATGEILSMVGNSFQDGVITDHNNIATSRKQIGSTMKPLVYSAAFAKTLPSPGSVIFDVPIQKVGDKFRNNFDGKFNGPMSIREALAQSRNIPALKMYTIAGGQVELINYLEKIGITAINRSQDYGDSLALGAADIPMTQLVQAYSVLANGGKFVEINPILEVKSGSGEILEDNRDRTQYLNQAEQVISPEEAFMINNILSDQGVNFSDIQALPNNRPVASKTGTSTKPDGSPSDLWMVGYTKQKVTAVWVGNSNGEALSSNATGLGAAAPIWNSIMNLATKDDPILEFEKPDSIQRYKFSKLSGDLPSQTTPANMIGEDFFMPDLQPTNVDSSYFKSTVDIRNNKSTNKYCPEIYVKDVTFWNYRMAERYSPEANLDMRHNEILNWFNGLNDEAKVGLNLGENVVLGFPISDPSDFCKRSLFERSRSIDMIDIQDGDGVEKGVLPVKVNASAASGIAKIEYYLNDSIQYTYDASVGGNQDGTVRISPSFAEGRELTIRVVLYDEYGYKAEDTATVYVGEGKRANNEDKPTLSEVLGNKNNDKTTETVEDLNIVIE